MTGVSFSNRQYKLMKIFADGGANFYMSIAQAQQWDQRPFRSFLKHDWLAYSSRHRGFYLTREGWQAREQLLEIDIRRHNPSKPLTAYCSAT